MRKRIILLSSLIFVTFAASGMAGAGSSLPRNPGKPKLMVLVVIDQFRADYLTRFESRFLPPTLKNGQPGGFRYLMSKGAYYPFAKYDILQSMTGPGHSTVLSGAYPYQSGIVLNYWYDTRRGAMTYCTEDPAFKTIGETIGAQVSDPHVGTSPANLIASTVGDELKNAGYPSRVVSIAAKDRAAILMGGHRADIAAWIDPKSYRWVTSRYYVKEGGLPAWLEALNRKLDARRGETISWEPEPGGHPTGFSAPEANGFPHRAAFGSREMGAMPAAVEVIEQAAESALETFELGRARGRKGAAAEVPDLLAVSFSNFDYGGHAYGPNSLEMEEFTVAQDRVLAKLLAAIDKRVEGGLGSVVIALTGDHGVSPNPDWLAAHGQPAGRISEEALIHEAEAALNEKFGKLSKWFVFNMDFDFFLNRPAIAEKGWDLGAIEEEAKKVFSRNPGVAQVFTSEDYRLRRLPPGAHERQILHTYFPGRSGDLVLIPKPHFVPVDRDLATHLTGYNYDRMVPLILEGTPFKAAVHAESAEVIDLAPTLSFIAGTLPPNLSEGRVLVEALRR